MVAEAGELANGWPLGLENMNIRLRMVANLQAAGETAHVRSASFDTFTSSELNTESTRSFFQDHSVSLARIIGLIPGQGGDFYLTTDSIRLDECPQVSVGSSVAPSNASKRRKMSQGNCIPKLLNAFVKITPCKSSSSRS